MGETICPQVVIGHLKKQEFGIGLRDKISMFNNICTKYIVCNVIIFKNIKILLKNSFFTVTSLF